MSTPRKGARPLSELPVSTRSHLEDLLTKYHNDPHSMQPGEKAFLFGRRDYLTADQRAHFELDEKTEAGDETKRSPGRPPKTKPEAGDEEQKPMSKTKIKAELKKLEIEFDENASEETLAELLKEAQENV